uniref:Uncharacterized protein n=1 Tax=Eutreptiella gymnastica TaxID=73025 RepID=A0A6U8KCJ1_9EUGL|mmetsp:Transcript_70410/g.124094  ORF Transcript_70410/g.124094 Transcript_70410/m.124094 type:complete len:118 (+) Transcript_70410:167-520(+)
MVMSMALAMIGYYTYIHTYVCTYIHAHILTVQMLGHKDPHSTKKIPTKLQQKTTEAKTSIGLSLLDSDQLSWPSLLSFTPKHGHQIAYVHCKQAHKKKESPPTHIPGISHSYSTHPF